MILEKPVQRLRPYTLKASKPSLALLQKPLGGFLCWMPLLGDLRDTQPGRS